MYLTALVIPVFTLASVLLAQLSQSFAGLFWDDINLKTDHANKPSLNPEWNFWVNNLLVGIISSQLIFPQNMYIEDLTLSNIFMDMSLVLGLTLLYDLQTYIFHRASHTYSFLKKMHAVHHEFNMPNSIIAGLYGDNIELIIITIFALWPLTIIPLPIGAVMTYLFLITFFVQLNHSGKKVSIPYIYTYKYHYNHHRLRNCNYCEHLMICDRIFGTLNLSD